MIKCIECPAYLPMADRMDSTTFGQCRLKSPTVPPVFVSGQLQRQWPQVASDDVGCWEGTMILNHPPAQRTPMGGQT